ncbi:MAG: zinc ribbon domain-containing protein [Polyangiales bacterium]
MPSSGGPASGATIQCPVCAAVLPADASFCLQCGSRLPDRLLGRGLSPTRASGLTRPHGTILGAAAKAVTAAAEARAVEPAAHDPATSTGAPPKVPNAQRTMLGVPLEPPPGAPAANAPPRGAQATLMGVSPQAAAAVAAVHGAPPPTSGRTMMGVPARGSRPGMSAIAVPDADNTARRRRENAPMIGVASPEPGPPAPPPEPARPAPLPSPPPSLRSDSGDLVVPGLSPRPRRGAALLVGGALILIAAAAGGYLAWKRSSPLPPPLAASVRLLQGGVFEAEVHLDGATAGTKLRHAGVEHEVGADGVVRFPLQGVSPSQVGEVEAPVEIVHGGAVERRTLRFVIGYRVDVDLSHTADDPPRAHLNFRVPPGATLEVAGQSIRVSGGVGIAAIPVSSPIPLDAPDPVRRERYSVSVRTARGERIEGSYELRLRRAELRITAPGALSLARQAMVTVRGHAQGATRVRVGAAAATVRDGVFEAEVAAPDTVNQVEVTAWAPGFAPASTRITVYRGITADAYLASGGGDRGVLAIATTPPPAARTRFRGQVLVPTTPGIEVPTAQVLVQDRRCPEGRCVVFVELPSGVSLREREAVDVVGETHGARGYLTPSGERRSAAVVRALLVNGRP